MSLRVFADAALTQELANVLSSWSVDAAGVLHLTPASHKSGNFYLQLKVFDLTDRVDTEVFALSVAPVADAPTLSAAAATPVSPLSKPTLDSGAWALNIASALVDQDGSETLEVRVSGLPAGLTLSAGANLGGGVWSLTPAQLAGLQIQGPSTWSQDLSLTITAIAKETANNHTAQTQTTLNVVINARPTALTPDRSVTVNENVANGALVANFTRIDADSGDTATYALVNNAGGRFAINASTGALTVANGVLLNFEAATSHTVRVRVTDSGGLAYEQDFNVSVSDVNEAPTNLTFANATTSIAENTSTASRIKVADLVVTDDALGSEAFGLSGADAASFEIISGVLYLKAGVTLNYEAKTSYTVNVTVDDTTVGATPDVTKAFTLSVTNVNEAPTAPALTVGGTSFTTNENQGVLNGTVIKNTAGQDIQFTAADPEGNALRYEIVGGTGAGKFSIGSDGKLYKQGDLDYETGASYTLQVKAWDGGAIGQGAASAATTFSVSVVDQNEAPRVNSVTLHSWSEPLPPVRGDPPPQVFKWAALHMSDPDAPPSFQHPVTAVRAVSVSSLAAGWSAEILNGGYGLRFTSGSTIRTAGIGSPQGTARPYWFYEYHQGYANQPPPGHVLTLEIVDAAGAISYAQLSISLTGALLAPVVLDLDGDGIELVSIQASGVAFDTDGDGDLEHTGWIRADDGMLVLDVNGNGLIDNTQEIAFSGGVDHAVSDLEGLRAYDTNQDGFLDELDDDFELFRVWRDLNQDGVSQAEELGSLFDHEIASINLTLSPTGESLEGATDNVIYGVTDFVRTDGTHGVVGDIFLAHENVEISIGAAADVVLSHDGGAATSAMSHAATNDQSGLDRLASGQNRRRATQGAVNWTKRLHEEIAAFRQEQFDHTVSDPGQDTQARASWLERLLNDAVKSVAKADAPSPLRIEEVAWTPAKAAPSALHAGLGVADKRVLHMVDAMARFGPQSASDLSRTGRARDMRVAELLTTLPDIRQG